MRSTWLVLLLFFNASLFCKAQVADRTHHYKIQNTTDTARENVDCKETSSSLLLNSLEKTDDWQIISGPRIKNIHYPVQPDYTRPFPSWEMDRYSADSSYFKDCEWMVLPDKKKVINTTTRLPVVFIKKFTTLAPSKLKLIVKMLYDNMAYLYIDSTWIKLHHRNPDVNRFIKKLRPELSGFVSIPSTFNFSYNASFYAGDFYDLVLPAGDHVLKIELFNNAYELGCIIKGMLISENDEKIFCRPPVQEVQSEMASILLFRDEKTFPKNNTADELYADLMLSVKKGYWINSLVSQNADLVSHDTLFIKKGEKINLTPIYVTEYYNGHKDSVYAKGSCKKINKTKVVIKKWDKTFVFDASLPGSYSLEINCESPTGANHSMPRRFTKVTRIIQVNK